MSNQAVVEEQSTAQDAGETSWLSTAQNAPRPADTPVPSSTREVTKGDNLWDIAEEVLGDPTRWPEIYEANRELIGDNPDLILPGQMLNLGVGGSPPAVLSEAPSLESPTVGSGAVELPSTDGPIARSTPAPMVVPGADGAPQGMPALAAPELSLDVPGLAVPRTGIMSPEVGGTDRPLTRFAPAGLQQPVPDVAPTVVPGISPVPAVMAEVPGLEAPTIEMGPPGVGGVDRPPTPVVPEGLVAPTPNGAPDILTQPLPLSPLDRSAADTSLGHPFGDGLTSWMPSLGAVNSTIAAYRQFGLGQDVEDRSVSGLPNSSRGYALSDEGDGMTGAGLHRDTGFGLGVAGETLSGRLGIGANIHALEQSLVIAAGRETALTEAELVERRALMQNSEPGSQGAAEAFIEGFGAWQVGDRYADVSQGGFGVSLSRPGLVSVGGGYSTEGEQRRDFTVGEDGRVIVRLDQRDAETGRGSLDFGGAALSLGGDATGANVASQTLEFDIQSADRGVQDDARRDLTLYQFAGLMPGTAGELGIHSYDDALAFVEGGADVEARASGTPDELNAAAVLAGRTDTDFATANGYVGLSEGRDWEQNLGLSALGIDLLAGNWTQARGNTVLYDDGQRVELETGSSTDEVRSVFFENERNGSRVVADEEGGFRGVHYTSGEALEGAGGELVPVMDDPAIAAAVDDPTWVRSFDGDLAGIGEAFGDVTLDADRGSRSVAAFLDFQLTSVLGEYGVELRAAARERGVDPEVVREEWWTQARQIRRLEAGRITPAELAEESPDALRLYAEFAAGGGGEQRFNSIAALATLGDLEGAAEGMADVVSSGDADVLSDLQTWAEANGMGHLLQMQTELVAGSTHLGNLNRALASDRGRVAAAESTALLTALEAAGMDDGVLQETLTGFDRSGGADGEAGLMRFYRALPPSERARFMAVVGGTEAGRGLLLDIAGTRPEMLVDPSVPPAERATWLEENALPAFGGAGADMDAATLAEQAETSGIAALERGDAWSFGPEAGLAMDGFRSRPGRMDALREFGEGRSPSAADFTAQVATLPRAAREAVIRAVSGFADAREGGVADFSDPRMMAVYDDYLEAVFEVVEYHASNPSLRLGDNLQGLSQGLSRNRTDLQHQLRLEG